jgi:23S rRNA (cytidine1920-2'-O)/16S rRNA (cytidine1409-2'-O)-methyltransferase
VGLGPRAELTRRTVTPSGPPDPAGIPEPTASPPTFVSRGGLKLHHALSAFGLDVSGMICADLGCSTGGFTDCLIQAGAERVFAVDTAYGELAWKLRSDDRVTVMERTNAVHAEPHEDALARGGVDLVVIDLGWTPQRLAIPAALRWCSPGGRVISLIKPHYERSDRDKDVGGIMDDAEAERWARKVAEELPAMGVRVVEMTESPVRGGARKKGKKGTGNLEWLALLAQI